MSGCVSNCLYLEDVEPPFMISSLLSAPRNFTTPHAVLAVGSTTLFPMHVTPLYTTVYATLALRGGADAVPEIH